MTSVMLLAVFLYVSLILHNHNCIKKNFLHCVMFRLVQHDEYSKFGGVR